MKLHFCILTVLVATLIGAAPAVAQEATGTATSTATPGGGLTQERVLSIVENYDPELTSPELARQIRGWLRTNGGELTSSERRAVLAWTEAALGKATATSTPTSSTAANGSSPATSSEANRVDRRVSDDVELRSWSYQNGRFTLVLVSDGPGRVMLTDVGSMLAGAESGRGVSSISARGVTLDGGRNVVTFHVTEHDGEAFVAVADGANAVQISTGSSGDALDQLDRVPGGLAFLLGALVCASWFTIAALHTLRRERAGVIELDAEVIR